MGTREGGGLTSSDAARKAKDLRLKKVYGISLEEWEALAEYQGWVCGFPTCDRKIEPGKRFSVDHNHNYPFEVRAIVCYQDNRYKIGSFTADEAYQLWLYLKDPPATQFFGMVRSVPPGMEQGQKRKRKRRSTVKRNPRK